MHCMNSNITHVHGKRKVAAIPKIHNCRLYEKIIAIIHIKLYLQVLKEIEFKKL